MSEVGQAAERLRRWKEDCFTCNMAVVGADRAELADAYLAEHLPDDDVRLDSDDWHEWWHSHRLNTDGEIIINSQAQNND